LITKLLFVAEFQLACVSQQHYVSLRLRTKCRLNPDEREINDTNTNAQYQGHSNVGNEA